MNIATVPQALTSQQDWYDLSQKDRDDAKTDEDVAYQDIIYFKCEGKTIVDSASNVYIDLPQALQEIRTLGWGNDYVHFIGFEKVSTNVCLQFAHYGENQWYADVPIAPGRNWDGYTWGCHTHTESVLNVTELFFVGGRWFDSLKFTMRRDKKYLPHTRADARDR